MTNKQLYCLWGGLYILCAGLGFLPEPGDVGGFFLTALSVLFFVPGLVLLGRGERKPVCLLSALSLGSTLVLLILNVWSVAMTAFAGDLLYVLLGLLSAPMYSSRFWLLSLFLWACLLAAGFTGSKKPTK